MEEIVHLRIKKEYAAELIKDLIRANALEYVEESELDIPEWQKEAVLKTFDRINKNEAELQTWEEIKAKYVKK